MTEIRSPTWTEEPIIKSSHCPRRWKQPSSSHNPQSDITSEEHLKILLRILSTYKQNYFSIITLWIRFIWVHRDSHILSTHTRGSSQLWAISSSTTSSGIQFTSPDYLHTQRLSKGLDTRCTGTSLLVHCLTKSGPKSELGWTRKSCELLFLKE